MSRAGLRIALLVLTVVMAASLLAGCGDADTADGDRALSKREYIAQANDLQQEAATVFAALDGRLAATPATAKVHLEAFDRLIAGYDGLRPPRDWRDEHATLLGSLQTMRQSMLVVSRASPRNRKVITVQVARYEAAQVDFEQAVRSINATR